VAKAATNSRGQQGAEGDPPADRGLTRQGLELPAHIAAEFRALASTEGRSVKGDGTAAIALLNSLPRHVAEPLLFWADNMVRRSPHKIRCEDAWKIVLAAIERGPDVEAVPSEALLEMLLDTQRPGRDASPETDRPPTKRAG
jgi:hypothetical protein